MSEFWQGFWLAAGIFSSIGASVGVLAAGLCMCAAAKPMAPMTAANDDDKSNRAA